MNTCMQCLLSVPELNYYFASNGYKKDKISNKKENSCMAYKEFIELYYKTKDSFKANNSLYKVCHSFLEPGQQHDCQEFLRRLLGKIQEEINGTKKYNFPDKSSYDEVWNIYKDNNPSLVDTLFSGLMRSSVICNKCKYKSGNYNFIYIN
jgi:ubiquitin carboxyl-terminal hydrolase 4/11/15